MNLGDHRTALTDDLSVSASDTFYATATLNRFINRAVKFLAALHPWQELDDAKEQTLTLAGTEDDEYWDIPDTFYTDSIYRLDIGGESYKKLTWREYLYNKEEYPTNDKKVFSDHRRQVFITPRPTTAGAVLSVWGKAKPTTLASDSDEHPWDGQATMEEAIHRYALGLALQKARGSHFERGKTLQTEAVALAEQAWAEQKKAQADYKTEHAEMFEHTDFIRADAEPQTRRGSFNTC